MKKILLIAVLFTAFISVNLRAQDKTLTIEDAVIGQWRQFYPDYIQQLSWRGTTDKLTYVDNTSVFEKSVKSSKGKEIIKAEDLNSALKNKSVKELTRFPYFKWVDNNVISFNHENRFIKYNVSTKSIDVIIEYNEKAENIEASIQNNMIAYTVENNLFIGTEAGETKKITNDTDKGIVNGQTVHRNEFGISKGTYWSPKGTNLAFYRKDETMVSDYPLVDITQRVATVENKKYPMAGMKSHHVTVGVYNIKSGKTTFLNTGEPKEQYLTNVAWSPDEKSIYIAVLNREQNHMKLNQYDVATGNLIKTLFEEKHDKYVEPENPVLFLTSNPNQFIWQSERDGYNHLYLYNTKGEMIKQITKGEWIVKEIIGFDKGDKNIIFTSTMSSPLENVAYKVNISTGKITRLTKDAGTHNVVLSKSGRYLIDTYSSIDVPKEYNITDIKGKKVNTLLVSENKLKDHKLGEMEMIKIKSADGKTDLYGRLIKPVDFDASKKYPAIIYVYGGPHAQMVTNSWLGGVSMWQYYMAQEGYVMLTIDNRGSANRGFEFENVIHRNVGSAEVADQMKGVDYLKELGYVDMDKIGVHGWSYGGFMTSTLMTDHNDIFKVGVAGGPVIDWKYYEAMYGERYMDTPEENPEGYENASLINKVEKLDGKLLIIQGYLDATVVPQHCLSFLRECVKKDVMVDFFTYPRHEHNVRGMDRIHLMKKVTQYFDDYLK